MIKVGKHTYGHESIQVIHPGSDLIIGNFCSLASNIKVLLGGNHRTDWITTFPFGNIHTNLFNKPVQAGHPSTNGDIIIGNDVWIGHDVTIMSGITIGDGAVIANNSHVITNVKPYSINGGNPATFYYFRFDKDIIDKLLKLKWWDLPDDKINEIIPLLCSNKFDELFKFCNIV